MIQFDQLFANSGLSLERLYSFLKVAETGSLTKAAQGDQVKQSQYSRQIKELEGYFGVALTRLVGRRIEITEEGRRLALVIQRQLSELDDFRESMAGRCVRVSFGTQGSIIDWMLLPRMDDMRKQLCNVIIETEAMRTMEVVRAVKDGRLDFGIVRDDSLPPGTERHQLHPVGYALFAANALWEGCSSAMDLLAKAPFADLLPSGQFTLELQQFLNQANLRPQTVARVSFFADLARLVLHGQAAAVLPEMAALDFDSQKFRYERLPALKPRMLAMISNTRSLARAGIEDNHVQKLVRTLKRPLKYKGDKRW